MLPALPDRAEFLSDAWIDMARAFLQRQAEQRGPALQPFSLSERFTHAPPHLKLPRNAAAWTVRYDGALTVERGFDETADLTVEGDYQATLHMAQIVGATDEAAMAAAYRETRRMYGKNAPKSKGAIADPCAKDMIALLHDHMARRTLENPDLAHRAARQGLTAKIREVEEVGYAVIENAISDDFADEVRETTLRALTMNQKTTMNWMLYQGRALELLFQNPLMLTLVDASLGRGAVVGSFSAIRRGPGPGFIPIHTDYAHVPEPYPEFAMTGVGVWALEDWTIASGPTWMVPGSNKMRRAPKPGEGHNGGVPIEMPKGSVVYFTHGVWHWQGERTEPGERVTLHAHFNRGILRSLEPKRVDVQMLHRNGPRIGEMLGEDDWFDKLDANGRDYNRFAYMNKLLAFTEQQKRAILEGAA